MGTKNNPGNFDCYKNALPDEPMFIMLGRDKASAEAVRFWALQRIKLGLNKATDPQIAEAYECAAKIEGYKRDRVAEAEHAIGNTDLDDGA